MFVLGKKDNGKNDLLFCNGHVHHIELIDGKWSRAYTPGISKKAERIIYDNIDVPCGKCMECKLDYSREWANRCLMEMVQYPVNMFVTLTYDDEHIKSVYGYKNDKFYKIHTVSKKDLQDFFKRLRKYYGDQKIRYFGCLEYGEKTHRPHAHAIIFNAIVPDLELHSMSNTGKVYTSKILADIWKNGNVLVAEANWNTAAYVARYVTKKVGSGESSFIKEYGLEPETIMMSRRPGLGSWYYENNDVFKYDHIMIGTEKGLKKFRPPRYFEKKLEQESPDKYKELKDKKYLYSQISSDNFKRTEGTDLEYLDYLEVRERNLKARVKSLERRKQ